MAASKIHHDNIGPYIVVKGYLFRPISNSTSLEGSVVYKAVDNTDLVLVGKDKMMKRGHYLELWFDPHILFDSKDSREALLITESSFKIFTDTPYDGSEVTAKRAIEYNSKLLDHGERLISNALTYFLKGLSEDSIDEEHMLTDNDLALIDVFKGKNDE